MAAEIRSKSFLVEVAYKGNLLDRAQIKPSGQEDPTFTGNTFMSLSFNPEKAVPLNSMIRYWLPVSKEYKHIQIIDSQNEKMTCDLSELDADDVVYGKLPVPLFKNDYLRISNDVVQQYFNFVSRKDKPRWDTLQRWVEILSPSKDEQKKSVEKDGK